MTIRDKVCGIVAFAVIIVVIAAFISWTNGKDHKLMEAVEAYEQCVITEYNTTPSAWYEEHGEYPPCDLTAYATETDNDQD